MGQGAAVSPVEKSVGYMLKKAASTLRSAMDAALRPLELTVPQYSCLELLGQRPGLSGSELARATFVTRQSMSLVLQGLERRGLLTRPDVPDRGKALPTQLTAAGRRQLRTASEAVRAVELRMLAVLPPGAERRLCQDLTRCVAALGQPSGPTEAEPAR